MHPHLITTLTGLAAASCQERHTFPDKIAALMAAGIERYGVDYCCAEMTFFLPNGESHVVPCDVGSAQPACVFSAAGVEAAVRASQAQRIKYQEFCRQTKAAGCVGYMVSIVGRRVSYFGRTGDAHIELFPGGQSQVTAKGQP